MARVQKNGYKDKIIHNIIKKKQNKKNLNSTTALTPVNDNSKKWITLTYTGNETYKIANILRKQSKDIKIAFKTDNNIRRLIPNPINNNNNKYNKCGIYKLKCKNCDKYYVGRTTRNFKIRYNEHIKDFIYNRGKSNYANHLYSHNHEYDIIENSLEILHTEYNFHKIKTLEEIEILKAWQHSKDDIVNDTILNSDNALYKVLIRGQRPGADSVAPDQQQATST